MIDDKTPALDFPLPHPENLLDDDVLRLRAALIAIDTQLAQPTEVTYTRDADGRITSATEILPTGLRQTTLVREGGQLARAVSDFAGRRATTTYRRDAAGRISGYQVEETEL